MVKTTRGVVKYFNPKSNHGKITSDDSLEEIYVHISDVIGNAVILMAGEFVEFELEQGPQSLVARKLVRQQQRLTGEVVEFEKGKGIVECHSDKKQYSIYFRDFIGTDGIALCQKDIRIKCESGEELEFYAIEDERYGAKAVDIIMVDSRKPLEKFAYLPNLDQHLSRLASLSDENWNFNSSGENSPVLKNYLTYTFARLVREEKLFDEEKMVFASNSTVWNGEERIIECCCFNTGLADRFQQEVYGYFEENLNKKYSKDPKWVLKGFFAGNKGPMGQFARKPQAADYMKDLGSICDLMFNPSNKLELSYDQLLEDRENRFPESFRRKNVSDEQLVNLLDLAVKKAIKRVRRNYKTAVPQYFNHKIQLLLPLCLESDDKVDLALVVEKKDDGYISSAVLDLEKAYSNARLIAKPDREWLTIPKTVSITSGLDMLIKSEAEKLVAVETPSAVQ